VKISEVNPIYWLRSFGAITRFMDFMLSLFGVGLDVLVDVVVLHISVGTPVIRRLIRRAQTNVVLRSDLTYSCFGTSGLKTNDTCGHILSRKLTNLLNHT